MKVRIKTIEEMLPDISIGYDYATLDELKLHGFSLKDGSSFTHLMTKYCGKTVEVNPLTKGFYDIYIYNMAEGYPYNLSPLMYEIPTNRNGANT